MVVGESMALLVAALILVSGITSLSRPAVLRPAGALGSTAHPIVACLAVRRTSSRLSTEYRWKLASLLQRVRAQSGEEDERKVRKAFRYAYRFHRTQYRQSGEPYITCACRWRGRVAFCPPRTW